MVFKVGGFFAQKLHLIEAPFVSSRGTGRDVAPAASKSFPQSSVRNVAFTANRNGRRDSVCVVLRCRLRRRQKDHRSPSITFAQGGGVRESHSPGYSQPVFSLRDNFILEGERVTDFQCHISPPPQIPHFKSTLRATLPSPHGTPYGL